MIVITHHHHHHDHHPHDHRNLHGDSRLGILATLLSAAPAPAHAYSETVTSYMLTCAEKTHPLILTDLVVLPLWAYG